MLVSGACRLLVWSCLVAVAWGQSERLPGESLPLEESLELTVYLDDEGVRSLSLEGQARLWVQVVSDTSQLVLHAGVSVLAVTVYGADAQVIDSSYEQPQDGRQFLVVSLTDQVAAGSSLSIEINFSGKIGNRELGFAQYDYQEGGETKAIYATQFEPDGARLAFPCYDEPALKARYSLSVRARDGWTVLCNTPPADVQHNSVDADGFRTFRFQQTPPMSSYLVAWVVLDEPSVVSLEDPSTTIWTVSSTLPQAVYSSHMAPRMVAAMEQLVGVPYSQGNISKVDHVAIPSFIEGGMENWGLITYTQGRVLLVENYTSEATKEQSLATMQHEVAHQWFGDLVSPRWWSVLWLNEGFATFFQAFATAVMEPTWRLREVFTATTLLQTAMPADVGANVWPLTKNISSADEAFVDFNIYEKGASVIWMMENIIGTEAFYSGLNKYLTDNQLRAATDEALFGALGWAAPAASLPAGASLASVMLPWARQAGFPLVTVARNYSGGSATVSQAPYISLNTEALWPVPLTYTTRSEADFSSTAPRLWLLDQQQTVADVAAPADWLLLNLHVAGYYRVNYDEQNWALLTQQLLDDPEALPPANRAQLLDDAASLAGAAFLVPPATGLRLLSYLSRESDYIPWRVASGVLRNFERLVGADVAAEYAEFAVSLVQHLTDSLGFHERPGEDHVTRIFRAIAVSTACNFGQPACLNATYQQFQRYMADPEDPANWVDPDLKRTVYCQGVQQGGGEAYNFIMNQYQTSTVISELNDLLMGASCSMLVDGLRMLELTAEGAGGQAFRRDHLLTLLEALLERPSTAGAALDFISSRAGPVLSPSEKSAARKMLIKATLEMWDEELLSKVERAAAVLSDASLWETSQWRRDVIRRGQAARRDAARWLRGRPWRKP